jgi:hypothetical protein
MLDEPWGEEGNRAYPRPSVPFVSQVRIEAIDIETGIVVDVVHTRLGIRIGYTNSTFESRNPDVGVRIHDQVNVLNYPSVRRRIWEP